jgi:hypothetical protein
MLIREIDRKLDMELNLRVRQDTDFFEATRYIKEKLPVYVYGKDGQSWMSTYFPKQKGNPDLELMINNFNPSEREDSYVIDTRINSAQELSIVGKLMDLPSFMINRSDMKDGFLNIYSRFHSSQIDKVSQLLAEYTSNKENSRIDWMGPSAGIMRDIELINREYHISVVTFETHADENEHNLRLLENESEIMAEAKNNQSVKGNFRAVLYSNHVIDGFTPIDQKSFIYELHFDIPDISTIREESNKQHIIRNRYFIKLKEGRLEVTVFLPTANAYEYYSILFNIARRKEGGPVIKYILPYTNEIWEFI